MVIGVLSEINDGVFEFIIFEVVNKFD